MKEPTAPELLQAVVKIKELCSNRKSCNGCIFDNDVIGIFSNCAISACPASWNLNDLEKWLSEHENAVVKSVKGSGNREHKRQNNHRNN